MKIARVVFQERELLVTPEPDNAAMLRVVEGDMLAGDVRATDRLVPAADATFLPPTVPTKIIAAGLNYKDHAEEMKMDVPEEPCIFMKAPSSAIGHGGKIVCPEWAGRIDYEAELAFVIKKTARNINEEDFWHYVAGFTCLNDVTARILQKRDGQWTRAKSFDTFCPMGPWLETEPPKKNLRIRLYLNNTLRQDSNTDQFLFTPARILSFISSVMTLLPGDVISTGTPAGIGKMKPGDTVRVEIEGIGVLENPVT